MNKFLNILLISLTLALMPALSAIAQSLQEAAQRVSRQHDARVLSANTIERGGERVHVIRILTRDGVVRSVEVPAGRSVDRGRDFDRGFDRGRDREQERSRDQRRDSPRDRGGDRPGRERDRGGARERRER